MMKLKEKVKIINQHIPCNCDLDNWQPENSTGHSWVCRIHKIAMGNNINMYHLAQRWRISLSEAEKRFQEFLVVLQSEQP